MKSKKNTTLTPGLGPWPTQEEKPIIIYVHNGIKEPGTTTIKLLRYKNLEHHPNYGNPPGITITFKDPNSSYADFVVNAHDKQKRQCNLIRIESKNEIVGGLLWNTYNEKSGQVLSKLLIDGSSATYHYTKAECDMEEIIDGNSEIELPVTNGDTVTFSLYLTEISSIEHILPAKGGRTTPQKQYDQFADHIRKDMEARYGFSLTDAQIFNYLSGHCCGFGWDETEAHLFADYLGLLIANMKFPNQNRYGEYEERFVLAMLGSAEKSGYTYKPERRHFFYNGRVPG